MCSKKKMITLGIILILIIFLSIIYLLIPKIEIKLNGLQKSELNVGENYIEEGAEAYLNNIFNHKKLNIDIIGNIDITKIGKYTITYQTKYKNNIKKVNRIINVVDKIKPEITLNEEIKICKKNNLIEVNATAIDNYDGNISENIKYKVINNKVHLLVTDSSNNKTEIEESFKYIDDEVPILTLNNSDKINLNIGDEYIEYGANASDSCDGNITDKIVILGSVDTNTEGIYKIKYSIKDSLNNETIKYREVIVSDNNKKQTNSLINGATIYLTFDDGPGPYTEEILEILNRYNVKVTFFVTNQFPKYQYLIKEEYNNGHKIGIHTYSHKWSIYESVDSYLEDFNKIDEIIFNQTGIHTKIFRFPGGSSNRVSINYSRGIMTKLAKLMTDNGYTYFDWTFDSGDTNKNDNSSKAIINNIKKYVKDNGDYIILMHDIKKNTLEALPEIIEYLQNNGCKFSVLDENSVVTHFKIAN